MMYGVYVSGPGIVGKLLMRSASGGPYLLFGNGEVAEKHMTGLQPGRPYHAVSVGVYEEGDEDRGRYASDPDGTL